MRVRTLLPLTCAASTLVIATCQGALLRGYVGKWGSQDCNPCVPDVARAINTLRVHGDILGFHLGAGIPDFDKKKQVRGIPTDYAIEHWQGVQRLAGPNNQYIVATRSMENDEGGFAIIQMASRDTDGRRYRSNRHGIFDVQDVSPPDEDRVIAYRRVNADYVHAGGIQTIGNWVLVPIEGGDGDAKVLFYDLTNPVSPQKASYEMALPGPNAGAVAIAKVQDGRFLLIVGGPDCVVLWFYVSNGTSLATDPQFELKAVALPGIVESGWGAYQNTNLVTQVDGQLYLIGLHNNGVRGTPIGEDWVEAWRLDWDPESPAVRFVKVANRHVRASWGGPLPTSGIPRQCNLDAAAGVYVDPDGRLIVYATEHGADGPDGTVKMMEFRNQYEPTSCATIDDGWVELYDDAEKWWKDRSLMIDFCDRHLEAYENFDLVEGFGDKTSSARWCLPFGYRCVLFEHHDFSGCTLSLEGSGKRGEITDFDDHHFGGKTSSSRFEGKYGDQWVPILTLAWSRFALVDAYVGPTPFLPCHLVGGTLRVQPGRTLHILPGTTLAFKVGAKIVADGTLIADGTDSPIWFLSEHDADGDIKISSKLVIKKGGEIRMP